MSQKGSYSKQKLRLAYTLISGAFLFYVLYAFKAFNIKQGESFSGHGLLFRSFAFAILFMSVIAIFEFVLFSKIDLSKLKIKVLWYLGQWLIGVFGIFGLFNYFWNFTELSFHAFGLMALEVAMVMVVPIGIKELMYKAFKSKVEVRMPLSDKKLLRFISESGKETFSIEASQFLFAASAGNYVEVHFLQNSEPRKRLIRNTLKRLENDETLNGFLLRCHRSKLVNPHQIIGTFKKANKLTLNLGVNQVQVSSSYEESVLIFLEEFHPK